MTASPTPSETEATLRNLVEVQSQRLVRFVDFKREIQKAMDAEKVTDADRVEMVRRALEGFGNG